MKRSKFPYTARSSSKVIRHAVSIDERRAKFRSDLISESKVSRPHKNHGRLHAHRKDASNSTTNGTKSSPANVDRFRRRSAFRPVQEANRQFLPQMGTIEEDRLDPRRGTLGAQARPRNPSHAHSQNPASENECSSIRTHTSVNSLMAAEAHHPDDDEDDEAAPQDIEELWFPGCHADLGGGWPLANGEESPLSHGPLVWMVREAQRAGLEFDGEKMLTLNCCDEDYNIPSLGLSDNAPPPTTDVPEIEVTGSPSPPPERPDIFHSPHSEKREPGWAPGMAPEKRAPSAFHQALTAACTKGQLHDCLQFNNGLPHTSVLSWKIMEYLPFRRMDLRPDGSWKAISLPLPMGETRDIPEDACIHHSAIRRMEANEQYRPGNLIIGGGGRGVRIAPKEMGIGQWEVLKGEGDPVGMVYVRKGPSADKQIEKAEENFKREEGKEDHIHRTKHGPMQKKEEMVGDHINGTKREDKEIR